MGPKWAKRFTEISHKKRIRSTQRSVYLYEPYLLFSVFWPCCCWRDWLSQDSLVPTDSVNNSPVVPFKYKPPSPEPTPTTSSGSLSTCPNHLSQVPDTQRQPLCPRACWNHSANCLPCPACSFLWKPQQRLLPSCSFYLCLLTNLGAFLCGHLWHDVPFTLENCE